MSQQSEYVHVDTRISADDLGERALHALITCDACDLVEQAPLDVLQAATKRERDDR